jgi:hypothetical protein
VEQPEEGAPAPDSQCQLPPPGWNFLRPSPARNFYPFPGCDIDIDSLSSAQGPIETTVHSEDDPINLKSYSLVGKESE